MVFSLEAGRYALPLATVERVIRAAEVTPVPAAPDVVLGVIDIGGRILPVFDARKRFGLRRRPLSPTDHFLIARAGIRTVALVIDEPHGLIEQPSESMVEAALLSPGIGHIHGVLSLEDGLVLIHDLEQFLSPDEEQRLDRALHEEARHAG